MPAVVVGGEQEGDQAGLPEKLASRSFCRLGGVFFLIHQMVSAGAQWELARDNAFRALHATILSPGPVTDEEINAIASIV